MPQPNVASVHVNAPLTMVSIAYIQEAEGFISSQVFPEVPVMKQSNIYWKYTKNYWFSDEARLRKPGTESAGSGYEVDSTNTYHCYPYSFHKDIPDDVRGNADMGINVDRDATALVTQKLLIKKERIWATNYFTTSVWAKDYTGVASSPSTDQFTQWNDYTNSDPITDIETGRIYILSITGKMANKLVLGVEVFSKLKNHPDIVDRKKYTSGNSITKEILANLFEVKKVIVGYAIYATNDEGGTEAYSFINGKAALLVYAAEAPSLLEASGGYTFTWKALSPLGTAAAIKTFRMEHLEADRVEGKYAFDMKLTASDCGVYFATAVA